MALVEFYKLQVNYFKTVLHHTWNGDDQFPVPFGMGGEGGEREGGFQET